MTDLIDRPADQLAVGDQVEVDIGAVAHGGHCVARYDGRVIFVRLGLPGERAVVRLTEVRAGSFCRGEVVQVLLADPDRVDAPCSHFRPAGCGGCDFQHAAPGLQRELKATVIAEQLHRLAGLDVQVTVEALPPAVGIDTVGIASTIAAGFGWRTRVRWALDEHGRIGPRAARSHQVVGVGDSEPCLIAAPGLSELAAVLDVPAGIRGPSAGPRAARPAGQGRTPGRAGQGRTPGRAVRAGRRDLPEVVLLRTPQGEVRSVWAGQDPGVVDEQAAGHDFRVAGDGFWQVHPAAADALAGAVREALVGIPVRSAWDLYGGVGLFAAVLADLAGPDGSVVTVEGDARAAELAAENLAQLPGVAGRWGPVAEVLTTLPDRVDAIVLDPPRTGAGAALCADLAAREPAVIVYVACDPAALARDTAALADAGYRLDTLRAFDCFPQTHHVECVARFLPTG